MDTLRNKEKKFMCGRFYVDEETAREIERVIHGIDLQIQKMHIRDIYPSQSAGVLICHNRQKNPLSTSSSAENTPIFKLEKMRWGFPQYQKNGLIINARAETALERKAFHDSVLHRRCIISAKHFYEWDSDKNKVTFFREDRPVLFMAGFYNRFQYEDRFIILTTQANDSVISVHNRMPLVLKDNELENWIYDDNFTEYAFYKIPPKLGRKQEYEQQRLLLT